MQDLVGGLGVADGWNVGVQIWRDGVYLLSAAHGVSTKPLELSSDWTAWNNST